MPSTATATAPVRPSAAVPAHAAPAHSGAAPDRRRWARLALASSLVVSFLAASISPSPLYGRYEAMWHATPLIGTIAFAVYAFAVLVGLLWLGELATYLGRRPVLLAAVGGQIVSLAMFAVAGSFASILAGRVVQGLAAGAALGALSATMIESDESRGTIASAASPGAGSGSGAIVAGLAVSFLPGPTHTVYLILIAVLALQAVGIVRLIPAAPRRRLPRTALRPRVAIPEAARSAFAGTAPVMFSGWSLAGFYAALSPALYVALTGSDSVWESTLGLFLFASVASVSVLVLRAAGGRTMTLVGTAAMIAGLALTVVAVELSSEALYFAASAVVGVGFGGGFQGPIRTLVPLARPPERAGLMSAAFVVAYLGMGVPAVIAGALVSGGAPLTDVAVGLAAALGVLSAAALVATVRRR